MLKYQVAAFAFFGAVLTASVFVQQPALIPNTDISVVHYKAVPEWPQQPKGDKGTPAGVWNFAQVASVAMRRNARGNSSVVMTRDQQIWTGTVLRDLSGKAIEKLPTTSNPHGAVVAPNGDVYLGLLTGRVEKYVRW